MSIEVTIYDYVSGSDKNLIQSWMDGRTTREKAKLNATLITLREIPQSDWQNYKCAKKLKGQADLWEILAFPENVQLRPIGFFGPGGGAFTLLVGVIKKGGRLQPATALNMAQKRKEDVRNNPQQHTISHVFKQAAGVS